MKIAILYYLFTLLIIVVKINLVIIYNQIAFYLQTGHNLLILAHSIKQFL